MVEHNGCDNGRDVGIHNGLYCACITVFDSCPHCFARAQFFANTFENEHVGVHGHTNGQDNTCNAWQRECALESRENGHDKDQVEHKGNIGNKARKTVVDDHEDDDDEQTNQGRIFALFY